MAVTVGLLGELGYVAIDAVLVPTPPRRFGGLGRLPAGGRPLQRSGGAYLQPLIRTLDLLAGLYQRTGQYTDALRAAAEAFHVAAVSGNHPEVPIELFAGVSARYGMRLADSGDLRAGIDRIAEGISALTVKGRLDVPMAQWQLVETRTDVRDELARMLGSLGVLHVQLARPTKGCWRHNARARHGDC